MDLTLFMLKHYLKKEDFYSHLYMGDITDADYTHAKIVCKDFEIRNLEYHNLYVQSKTLLVVDVFGNFQNMYLGIYELDPVHFFSYCTRFSMASSFKRL